MSHLDAYRALFEQRQTSRFGPRLEVHGPELPPGMRIARLEEQVRKLTEKLDRMPSYVTSYCPCRGGDGR